jgi:AcrR family transcriptional regulator
MFVAMKPHRRRAPASAAAPKRKTTRKAAPPRIRGEGKQQILEAALRLFADANYDAISTADIAREAHTSQSVVLYHFGTKIELWREAMRRLFERVGIGARFESAAYKDLDPLSRLRVLLRGFVLTSARHPELGRVIFREGSVGGERLDWLMEEFARSNYAVFEGIFEEAARKKLIKPYPAAMLTILAHGAAATFFNLNAVTRLLTDGDPFSPEMVELQADLVIDVLINGLKS